MVETPVRQKVGLALPFQFGARDLATASGDDLTVNRAEFVLGNEGTLPWRRNMVAGLSRLRNQNGPIVDELARFYCTDQLGRWMRNVAVRSAVVDRTGPQRSSTILLEIQRTDTSSSKVLPLRVKRPPVTP